jgi:branched-chain amino acid aminotransferase
MVQLIGQYFSRNGATLDTGQFDPAVLNNGLVLYEVIRVVDHTCLFLEDHLDRLGVSVALSGRHYALDHFRIRKAMAGLMEWNGLSFGNMNLTLHFPAAGKPCLYAFCVPHSYPTPDMYAAGVETGLFQASRSDPNIKRILPEVREKTLRHIAEKNLYEVLLVRDNEITEGSRSNVFFITGDALMTPPGDRVLKGITRQKVIELCNTLNIKILEIPVSIDRLGKMDAAFLTGTSPKVLPIRKIGGVRYAVRHPLTVACMQAYDDLIRAEVLRYKQSV